MVVICCFFERKNSKVSKFYMNSSLIIGTSSFEVNYAPEALIKGNMTFVIM